MAWRVRYEAGVPEYRYLLADSFDVDGSYWTTRRRGSRDWLLTWTTGGAGRFAYAGGELAAVDGALVLIAPRVAHDYSTRETDGRWQFHWAHFHARAHWREWLEWPEASPGLMSLDVREEAVRERVTALFDDVVRDAQDPQPHYQQRGLIRIEEILLECVPINPRSGATPIDARVADAIDYLRGRMADDVTLAEIAHATGVSPSRLGTLFREQLGESPLQFLERQRMEIAKQRLDMTTRSITSIALEVGFDDPLYFSLRFKKHTGLSPRHYRYRATSDVE